MKINPAHRGPRPPSNNRKNTGFSLVEVVLALGVCSFAMIAIVGMIPVGLSTFKDAMNTTVRSQIVQSIASDVLLTDFSKLEEITHRYYDDQGALLDDANTPSLSYTAQVEQHDVTGPAAVPFASNATILIKIAKTHPGQSFAEIEERSPHRIYSYPVIVPLLSDTVIARTAQ